MGIQVTQHRVQRGRKETGMLGLEDKIIIGLGFEFFNESLSMLPFVEAMGDLLLKVGLPFAEVVIHVNYRDACGAGAFRESRDSVCEVIGVLHERLIVLELQVVDYID
jgi:hypothetical protein